MLLMGLPRYLIIAASVVAVCDGAQPGHCQAEAEDPASGCKKNAVAAMNDSDEFSLAQVRLDILRRKRLSQSSLASTQIPCEDMHGDTSGVRLRDSYCDDFMRRAVLEQEQFYEVQSRLARLVATPFPEFEPVLRDDGVKAWFQNVGKLAEESRKSIMNLRRVLCNHGTISEFVTELSRMVHAMTPTVIAFLTLHFDDVAKDVGDRTKMIPEFKRKWDLHFQGSAKVLKWRSLVNPLQMLTNVQEFLRGTAQEVSNGYAQHQWIREMARKMLEDDEDDDDEDEEHEEVMKELTRARKMFESDEHDDEDEEHADEVSGGVADAQPQYLCATGNGNAALVAKEAYARVTADILEVDDKRWRFFLVQKYIEPFINLYFISITPAMDPGSANDDVRPKIDKFIRATGGGRASTPADDCAMTRQVKFIKKIADSFIQTRKEVPQRKKALYCLFKQQRDAVYAIFGENCFSKEYTGSVEEAAQFKKEWQPFMTNVLEKCGDEIKQAFHDQGLTQASIRA